MENKPEISELGEVFDVNPSRVIKRGEVTPFIPMEALPEHSREVSRVYYREYSGSGTRFKNGDTLIARITPCLENGKTVFISCLAENVVAHGSTEYIVLSGKQDVSESLYGYYLARSPDFRAYAIAHMEGTSGRQRVPASAVENYRISLPPLPEQRGIAELLGSLDDKIALNRHMNQTLETLAQAIFKSWFIDFDPVRAKMEDRAPVGMDAEMAALFPDAMDGDVPKGWRKGSLAGEFNLTMGQSPPGSTYNELKEGLPFFQGRTDFGFRFPTNRVYCTGPTRYANPGDTLVSVRAPVGEINMAAEYCALGRGVAAVRHKSGSRSFTYYCMKSIQSKFKQFEAEGTVFGSINKDDFKALEVFNPDLDILNLFEQLAHPIDQMIENNEKEITALSGLRDLLLPKLLSGEVKVENLDNQSGL